jgi:hypothetical protein
MKNPLSFHTGPVERLTLFAILIISLGHQVATGQTPVTAVFTHLQNASTATSYTSTGATGNAASGLTGNTYIYHFGTNVSATNNTQILDSFTAIGVTYKYQANNVKVYFRRVNNASVTGLRKSMWIQQNGAAVSPGGTAALYPDYDDSLERVYTERAFSIGIDNVFQNATTTNNNNIERMDVVMYSGGVAATDNTKAGFVVFDRGTSGGHDPFYIAAIQSLDASGNPSAYYSAVSVTSANYGSNVGGNVNYLIMRKNPGDAGLLMMNNNNSQNRDGVLIRFSDLGVPNNATIYGYSLFGPDVNVSSAANLVNYASSANFPNTTDLSGGGLDPVAVTGLWVTNASFVILPDRLQNFQANYMKNKVQLNWQLNVDNLKELSIERCGDAGGYSPLLRFSNPSPGPQSSFDLRPLPGNNYYRLKLVDVNSSQVAYSPVSAVKNYASELSMNIYPNPVKDGHFAISGTGLRDETYYLRLFDQIGKVVITRRITGKPSWNEQLTLPDGVAGGMYTLQLSDKDGNRILARIVRIH